MEDTGSDFTMTFRELSEVSAEQFLDRNFTQVELKVMMCYAPVFITRFCSGVGYLFRKCQRFYLFRFRCGLLVTCHGMSVFLIGSTATCSGSAGKQGHVRSF